MNKNDILKILAWAAGIEDTHTDELLLNTRASGASTPREKLKYEQGHEQGLKEGYIEGRASAFEEIRELILNDVSPRQFLLNVKKQKTLIEKHIEIERAKIWAKDVEKRSKYGHVVNHAPAEGDNSGRPLYKKHYNGC